MKRISFDLDDTLICAGRATATERCHVRWFMRPFVPELLRQGTVELLRRLVELGWEVAIYTTSNRSPAYIRWLFRCHGIRLCVVINQQIHDRAFSTWPSDQVPSKLPSYFGISLHVDDSEGVRTEGRKHGFDVVVVGPEQADWARVVLDAVAARQAKG